jgi:hypothetical protein
VCSADDQFSVTPNELTFISQEQIQFENHPFYVERTFVITHNSSSEVTNIKLTATNFDSLNSSNSIASDKITFNDNNFSIQPGDTKQIVAKIDVSNLGMDSYRGFIFVTASGAITTEITCTLSITQSSLIKYSVLAVLFVIIFISYWFLLKKEGNIWYPIVSFILVFSGLILLLLTVPFGGAINTILVTIVVSPIIAFLISLLTTKRDLTKSIDETTHTYRKTMIENESDMLGKLMGELSTHYATFLARDWPNPQKLANKVWSDSSKSKLISDTHIGLLSLYYYYVPVYNSIIDKIEGLKKYEKSNPNKYKKLKDKFYEIKSGYLSAEKVLYHALMYDVGFLQQNYLDRPNVDFPIHTKQEFEERLQEYRIIAKNERIHKKIFTKVNSAIFNKGAVRDFNRSFSEVENSINKFAKEIGASPGNKSKDFLLLP